MCFCLFKAVREIMQNTNNSATFFVDLEYNLTLTSQNVYSLNHVSLIPKTNWNRGI